MSVRHDVLFYLPSALPLLLPGERLPPGGAETQMVLIAREFVRRGLRVGFVVRDPDAPSSVDGIDLIVERPLRFRAPVVRSAESWYRTAGAIVRGDASAVVLRGASALAGVVALTTRVTGRRFVFSSANVVDFAFSRLEPSRVKVGLFRFGVRLANQVVVQSREQVGLARDRFGVSARLIPSVAEPAERPTREPAAFLWVGRLISYKGPEAYLDLAEAVPEARFRMLGVPSPPDGTRLAKLMAERARSLANVELLEPRPRAELAALYDEAVAVVNTAEFEGMPNVFLEGWSRGVPAVALKHDPDGTLAREGLGAFAGGDPTRLAEQVRELWAGRHNQDALAERCVAYVRNHHALSVAADAWAEVIGPLDA
jgi:glycosyltransferase involved in cell wall biosynthesis